MCLLAYPITLIYGNPDLFWPTVVISVQFVSNSMNIVPLAILEKNLNFKYTGRIHLISVIFTIGLMTGLAVIGLSYWSLIIPMVLQPLFKHIWIEKKANFGFYLYNWKLTKLGIRKTRSLLTSYTVINFVNYFARNADNFAVGKFYGEFNLGIYNRAYNFLYLARKFVNVALGKLLLPSLVNAKDQGEDIKPQFLDILGMMNLINICIAIPLILWAKPIVLVLWGKDWLGVADFMPYIGAIIPLQTLSIAAMDLYVLEHKEKSLITLEIPLTLTLIAGIVVGAFFSPLHIIRFYAISFVLVQTPLSLYFGHYKLFKFTSRQVFKFWVPKVLLTAGMIFSIWFGNIYLTALILAIFIFETVYFRFHDIMAISQMILEKLKRK